MRRLKCRAWDRDIKEMVYYQDLKILINNWDIIMWAIGKKDIRGKDIFEGDIIKGKFYYTEYDRDLIPIMGEVVYEETLSAYCVKNQGGLTLLHRLADNYTEVIGNKYEGDEK